MMNIQGLMKQAQMMQKKMQEEQERLEKEEFEGVSGGGMVKVVVNGKKVVSSVSINPDAVDVDDIEMLEDLIVAALNDAYSKADKLYDEKMAPFGGAAGMF